MSFVTAYSSLTTTSRLTKSWHLTQTAALAIEFQTYNPLGKLHETSFSMRVKEIERSKD